MELLIVPLLALFLLLGKALRQQRWEEQRNKEEQELAQVPASAHAETGRHARPDAFAEDIRAKWRGPWLPDPAPYWSGDLPSPATAAELPVDSLLRHLAPEHVDDIYLEIATRPAPGMRWMGVLFLPFLVFLIPSIFISAVYLPGPIHPSDLITSVLILGAGVLFTLVTLPPVRSLTRLPLGQPVRFNRARQTMYVYRFRFNWLKPLGEMCVRPARYKWSQLHAEQVTGPRGSGHARPVMLTVFDPVDRSVIDRFELHREPEEGAQLWAVIRLFMQRGKCALPTTVQTPEHCKALPLLPEPLPGLAPPIRWPTAMDHESRTAPSSGDT